MAGHRRQPPDAELYSLVPAFAGAETRDAPTFSKWGPELQAKLGADAGVQVRAAADACAAVDDVAQEQALAVMRLWAPLVEVASSASCMPY